MTPRGFRYLLIGSLLCQFAAVIVDFFFPHLVPESLYDAQLQAAANTFASKESLRTIIIIAIVVVSCEILAFIGMFMFKRWARTLGFVLVPISALGSVIIGFDVTSGWVAAFREISLVLWGAALAVSYFSPAVADRFNQEILKNN